MKRKLRILAVILISVFVIFPSGNFYAQTQRNMLIEFCTGTWCQWCPCGDWTIENLLDVYPNLIPLAYHGPVGQDPYSYFEGNQILTAFGFAGYPTASVDRASAPTDYTTWTSKVNSRANVPATVTIDLQRTFNLSTRQLDATISMTPLVDLTGQYKYSIVLTEDSLIYNQVNNGVCVPGGANWVHNWVVRSMINGYAGENVNTGATWGTGETITKTISYNVSSTFNQDKCHLVVFVFKQSSPMYTMQVQQAGKWTLISPDYLATISSRSPDIISESNVPGEFNVVLKNVGLLDDIYYIGGTLDGPAGWTASFTTVNGTFPFGQTDSVEVASGDSTEISLTINPNGFSGSGSASINFQSKNNIGMSGSVTVRFVTTTGVDILVIDGTEGDYGQLVVNSVENVYSGTSGIVSRDALNPSINLDNFQLITWSAGVALPVFHPEEVDLLQDYLDGDGKLFINGQDIGNDIFDAGGQSQFAQNFYHNYLHASFLGTGSSYLINGIAGDPITDGVQFVLNGVYTRTPDNIFPYDSYGSSIFKYFNGPNIAGIKAAANNHKVVYFGFNFEQITENNIRDTLISRIIRYSGVESLQLPSAPVLISPANSAVIDSASVLFIWQESQPQVSKYWLELDTTDQFSNPFVNSDVTDTTYLYSGLLPGKNYWWRVKAQNPAGWGDFSEVRTFSTLFVDIKDDESQIPTNFSLEQNYPNPFNPATTIAYSIPKESQVSLKIYDVMGREVAQLISDRQPAGNYNIEFNASALASGTYFYKLTAGDFASVKKMLLLK